jgi:phosphatidate cytidylyltransferase
MESGLWENKFYIQAVSGVVAFFFLVGGLVYFMQRRNPKWIGVWASIKSWVITSPLVFFFAALPKPWPLIFIVMLSIYGAKTFFRMTGMYHRSWFVWLTYAFLGLQGYTIYQGLDRYYDVVPMLFLSVMVMIPIFRNSHSHMIQFIALSLINFIMMGWGFMHLGRIVMWEGGPLIALYLAILFEFCEASNYALNRAFGRTKPLANITSRFSVEGFVLSILLTLILAWGLRGMLPDRSEVYWLTAGLAVAVVGRIGGLFLSVVRRDLNIKESGIFIIGRDDLLSRVDKPVFAAPVVYYFFSILQGYIQL